jgi:hypothetical protein
MRYTFIYLNKPILFHPHEKIATAAAIAFIAYYKVICPGKKYLP